MFPKSNKRAGKQITRNTVILPIYMPLKGQILNNCMQKWIRHVKGPNCSHISSEIDKISPKTINF